MCALNESQAQVNATKIEHSPSFFYATTNGNISLKNFHLIKIRAVAVCYCFVLFCCVLKEMHFQLRIAFLRAHESYEKLRLLIKIQNILWLGCRLGKFLATIAITICFFFL